MSDFAVRYDELTQETVYTMTHPTGVRIAVLPKPDYHTAYAVIGTKYGSIDNDFSVNGGAFTRVPDGIAHYLEHKLFEDEECGTYERFARTGAAANAYTTYDKTCYYFTCTQDFEASLEILLDFVQKPYFTEENVLKERGIIAQELSMYRDDPGWWVNHNLMSALYREHPIRIDIGGTEESIAQITPELLYRCYETFYSPNHLYLAVCGRVDPGRIAAICDRMLLPRENPTVVCRLPEDDGRVLLPTVEHEMDVSMPLFRLAFKEKWHEMSEREYTLARIVRSAVFGSMTDFYTRMTKENLINPSFGVGGLHLRGAAATMLSGMSVSPERLREAIFEETERVKREGISPYLFECARRKTYGYMISVFNNVEDVGDDLVDDLMFDEDCFESLRAAAEVTVDEANIWFRDHFDIANSAMSVVRSRRHKEA